MSPVFLYGFNYCQYAGKILEKVVKLYQNTKTEPSEFYLDLMHLIQSHVQFSASRC